MSLQNAAPKSRFLPQNRAIFVTGTDTGVGKTVVSALLALRIRQLGWSCGVLKPFASGCEWRDGELVSEDAAFLREHLKLADSPTEICPIRLEEPLAPLLAARRAGIETQNWPETARDSLETLRSRYDFVIVEGAGGILAPLWERDGRIGTNLDLLNEWQMPAVVAARRSLGTINHTLLTLHSPAEFVGIVFCDSAAVAADDVASQISISFLREQTEVPIWGEVPFLKGWNELEEVAGKLKFTGV